ncbi:hypothetical protein DSM3645_03068 [Blastopirellula marina DSM 3645]|uniref:Uncharacterized protein n=1 Tax=Blastopirellula marina DSM 3645 TaxID=314230 RepID=A3ZVS7_9BACT|nr:hypothetical protein DSM3645_03068 [Blastopirellula marina DSM 3645]
MSKVKGCGSDSKMKPTIVSSFSVTNHCLNTFGSSQKGAI